jgi:hypothetical protein
MFLLYHTDNNSVNLQTLNLLSSNFECIGITGNEMTNAVACDAIGSGTWMFEGVPTSDLATHLHWWNPSRRQSDWGMAQNNRLLEIKTAIAKWQFPALSV